MKTLNDDIIHIEKDKYSNINIEELLVRDKRLVTFVGTSKSGTSFLINNLADLLSSKGINTAILDATQNKSSYYIYTKNEESLRKIAFSSIENLSNGVADGIKVKNNLTVYTAVPGENKFLQKAEPVLETLIKNHSLILIDCDLKTSVDYFAYAQEIYLVQSMDVLSIQPLTEALAEMQNKGILDETKIRIIINKFVETAALTEKEIIGGMAFYNDPTMSYMKQLFNKNTVKYMTIPFEQAIYERYLGELANCNINVKGYSGVFLQILEQLGKSVYPFVI